MDAVLTEYISKRALIDALNTKPTIAQHMDCVDMFDAIESVPATAVQPVVRGVWKGSNVSIFAECSNCGSNVSQTKALVFRDGKGHIDFCPNCGADMRSKEASQ